MVVYPPHIVVVLQTTVSPTDLLTSNYFIVFFFCLYLVFFPFLTCLSNLSRVQQRFIAYVAENKKLCKLCKQLGSVPCHGTWLMGQAPKERMTMQPKRSSKSNAFTRLSATMDHFSSFQIRQRGNMYTNERIYYTIYYTLSYTYVCIFALRLPHCPCKFRKWLYGFKFLFDRRHQVQRKC